MNAIARIRRACQSPQMDFLLLLLNGVIFLVFIIYAVELISRVGNILDEVRILKNALAIMNANLESIAKSARKVADFTDRYPDERPPVQE
jgi:hypothetical protein